MKTVIAAIDFSPASRNAARYAADLAVSLKGDLLLVNVVEMPVILTDVPESGYALDQMVNDSERELMVIKDELVEYVRDRIDIDITVPVGSIAYSLQEEARQEKACCLVLGTDSLTPAEHLLLKNHALATVRSVSVPVLIVPPGSSFTTIKKIVLAVDLGNIDKIPTLNSLKEWMKVFGPTLDIVSVVKDGEVKPIAVAASHALQYEFAEFQPEFHFIYEDEVKKGIDNYVQKNDPDMLVTMPGNYSFFSGLFHKSQSKQLIRDTRIPVLAIS